jgi:methylenetetrahydrofolate dehydrogenase (NADP+)/methenyltetrahydrofolate cyclohydrolase
MAEARIIDGKAFAAKLRTEIAAKAEAIKAGHDIVPGLATVLVGESPASEIYVRFKSKAAKAAGMLSFAHNLPDETREGELLALIDRLNGDATVNAILVQLPLPGHISPQAVADAVDPAKDVDGFHLINAGRLVTGAGGGFIPCTPQGCMMLLKGVHRDLTGLKALVAGRSNIVGKPMASLLLAENCTVTMAHSRTRDLAEECRQADIVIAAVGQPQMIKGAWIKPGATVIDVGFSRIESARGKVLLVGDVDFAEAVKIAGAITPVPGGVGPMTIACLLRNTLIAACRQAGIEVP